MGEGCYASIQIGAYKYYGILIEHSALSAATELYFDNEATSLELNTRMANLKGQKAMEENSSKRARIDSAAMQPSVEAGNEDLMKDDNTKQIQKFQYLTSSEGEDGPGYRDLIATYANANAACENNYLRKKIIEEACENGGNFVGNFYYQYEINDKTLQVSSMPREKYDNRAEKFDMWTSMGFHTFLKYTPFPQWHPLSNVSGGQKKALHRLHLGLKKSGIAWNATRTSTSSKISSTSSSSLVAPEMPLAMKPRDRYRIGVIGGGISGLASAHELLRLSESQNIDVDIVLLEATDKFGGRIQTDYRSFKTSNGQSFPIDLGASWIYGSENNPIAKLAIEAGAEFMRINDGMKLLKGNMADVDKYVEKRVDKIFDEILDAAADECTTDKKEDKSDYRAMRWYASILNENAKGDAYDDDLDLESLVTDIPEYRRSGDISFDAAISKALMKRDDKFSAEEKNLLLWHMKFLEQSRNANIRDLSTKYWDANDAYQFNGKN